MNLLRDIPIKRKLMLVILLSSTAAFLLGAAATYLFRWPYGVFILPASMLLAWLLLAPLQNCISVPILKLAATARAVAERKDYSVRAESGRKDEVGLLTEAFNQMLSRIDEGDTTLRRINRDLEREVAERKTAQSELEDLHRHMLEISHQAGMAEVATGVLHNVGNVLNSINVSATLIMERQRRSKVSSVPRLARLFEDHAADLPAFLSEDDRGQQVPAYLSSLAQSLVDEQNFFLQELELLRHNTDHVKEIVAMQQSYARVSGVREVVQLVDLVEDAVKLHTGGLSRHGIKVKKEFSPVPPVVLDKHKVLQILINLIRNAKYALDDGGRPEKWMTVRVGANGNNRAKIEIADNGVGIPRDQLALIFAHGFTTRSGGHGFGLHSGALAATALGGSLTVHSDGPGTGATFTLEIPLKSDLETPAAAPQMS